MYLGYSLLVAVLATAVRAVDSGINIPLNITAISSRVGYSVLECWQLSSIPVDAMQAANYALGNTTVATWSKIEPRTHIGEAWAPHVQLSVILNGLIRITAPAPTNSDSNSQGTSDQGDLGAGLSQDTLIPQQLPQVVATDNSKSSRPETKVTYIMPGTAKSSVLIAADIKSVSTLVGHFTEFPSDEPTILVQVPFVDDKAPEHTILHDGPCI